MSCGIVWFRVRTRSRACSRVRMGWSCVPGFESLPLGDTKMFHGLSGPASNGGASIDASAEDDPPEPPLPPVPTEPAVPLVVVFDPAAPVVGDPPDPMDPDAPELVEVELDPLVVLGWGVPPWFDSEQAIIATARVAMLKSDFM